MEDMESVDIEIGEESEKVASASEVGGKAVGDILVDQRVKRKAKRIIKQLSKEGTQTGPNVVQVTRKWKNSRRPRNGYRGVKKGNAAGGTGPWGGCKLGTEMDEDVVDEKDPNYDSDSFENGDIQLQPIIPEASDEELRKTLEPLILEYYEHGDPEEVLLCLEDVNCMSKKHMIPQIAIEIALDHKPSQREMTSVLISDLYGRVIKQRDIANAFDLLLKNLPDLMLDTPDAPTVLGNFLARAIADDCLPPKIIQVFKDKTECSHAREAVSRADTLLSMKHGLVRLDNVWGVGGGLRPVKYLIRQVRLLLQEYLSSGDIQEATRCLLDLEVPHFHHELVYEAVVMTLEAINSNVEEAMVKLLKSLSDAIIITPDMMELGFTRVFEDMPDIIVDVPLASTVLERFVEQCEKNNVITSNVVAKMPIRARKRFVSEGDGGRLK